jgi:hypothetical protein
MPAPASYARRQFPGAAADTTIVSGINNTDLSVTLASATGWPTGAYTGGVLVELYNVTTGVTVEKVWSTNLTGVTLTIVRAADGTAATSHAAGTGIRPIAGAIDADEANRAVNETVGQITAAGQILIGDGTASLAALDVKTSGRIIVGNGTTGVSVAVSGDATLSAAGALTIANDAINAAKIAANAVGSSEIAADAVGSSELADNAVDTNAIAALAVTAAKIAANTITAGEIAPDAIGSSELADNAVDTNAIAALAVTAAKIAADTITASQIAANAIGSSELADNAVDTAAIANDAVTVGKMADMAANTVLEGPTGGGNPVATERGRSWAVKKEDDSVAIDTTPTQVTDMDIDAVAMKTGRRYKLTFCAPMGVTTGSGIGFVGFRRGGVAFSKYVTSTLTSVAFPGQNFTTFYEPSGDEAQDWSIWLESNSGAYNVRIKATSTEEAVFIIEDIGFATNT